MVLQQRTQESLQQRINEFLHINPVAYAIEEPKEESVEAIHILLQRAEKVLERAEEDLVAAQERVDRLKWELEKARS